MKASRDISDLLQIMAALRAPATGCAWDLVQTHESLASYAIEEAHEVVDAIERRDHADLRVELGDLLLQVVFHARVAEELGRFCFGDVVESITAKMVRRHPHVFSEGETQQDRGSATAVADQISSWERIKADERRAKGRSEGSSILSDIPVALPALTRAAKLQKQAASVGVDWNDARLILAAIREEVDEIEHEFDADRNVQALQGEIGDLFFAAANLARHLKIDPEAAVRTTNRKFERRFAYIEEQLASRGMPPGEATLEEMDALWDLAKQAGL